MAKFIGTLEEFEQFIGPATNKIVTKLGKALKKKSQASCQNHKLGEHTITAEKCGKHKSLDAAHFSHLAKDRKSIIAAILKQNFPQIEGEYEVCLSEFLIHYEAAHHPLDESLIMLCRQHHSAYDRKNRTVDEACDQETDQLITIQIPDNQELNVNTIKKALMQQIHYLEGKICNIAKISGKIWNFNINKENAEGFLLCYNQFDASVSILKYVDAHEIGNLKKNKETMSIIIPVQEEEFIDKASQFKFEFIEHVYLINE
ncbi:hypothetical protein ACPDHL_12355 [Myroides sp. C15-4]|uniref:hypothetical protein n=1 Tax=Myroides sp. C15-4 TaxID=3400532 RepID=UPI003D2F85B9